jgi:magnesium transporter
MNFKSTPLLDNPFGFGFAIAMMALVATTLALVFWRRKWLD